jgi:N-acetylglucosaminyldiphosphoundecaprenol N-acetyl-beta-D-mannosaminyltransferase
MRIYVADIPVDNITKTEALLKINGFLSLNDKPRFAVAINPEKIIRASRDRELQNILKNSDLNFVDGIGVIWASKIFYKEKFQERVPGIDLFLDVLLLAEEKNYSVFLLGSREEIIQKAVKNLSENHPKLRIAGFRNGYFSDEKSVVENIRNSKADILFVGMGSPKQEKFIYNNLNNLEVKFAMGVGGSFNVLAGEFQRAPYIVQKLGLEWLYRFLLDPKRFPRIISLPKFIFLVMRVPQRVKPEVKFFGVNISNRPLFKNLEIAEKFIKTRKFHLIVTLNGEMASKAFIDKEFFGILKKADLVIPDGIGIVWGARKFGERVIYRIPGIEFGWNLLKLAEQKGYSVYLIGAKEKILNSALEKIKASFPNLKVCGYHSGYFDKIEESAIIKEIKEKKPDILFVGMGGGKQEKWIFAHKDLNVPFTIGVGGSFDVWSGRIKRAPIFVQKIGLEWLYRVIIQPTRIVRMGNIISFALKVIFKKADKEDV